MREYLTFVSVLMKGVQITDRPFGCLRLEYSSIFMIRVYNAKDANHIYLTILAYNAVLTKLSHKLQLGYHSLGHLLITM